LKTQPAPNIIDNAQFNSDDFFKKSTIIETEGDDAKSTLVQVPKVILTSSQRPSQQPSIISEATNSLVAATLLDDKDNCYNEVPGDHAVVTLEKRKKKNLFPSASGHKKNQPSLINFVLKPPSDDLYPFNYTRAPNYRQTFG
jgi:hypothetical protein